MQRPTAETIRQRCLATADVAEPTDSYRRLAQRLAGYLSDPQVKRR